MTRPDSTGWVGQCADCEARAHITVRAQSLVYADLNDETVWIHVFGLFHSVGWERASETSVYLRCPTCAKKRRSIPLIQYGNYKRAHEVMHRLWSKERGDTYNKQEWLELERAIEILATEGKGRPHG